jgi:hypothetical protein
MNKILQHLVLLVRKRILIYFIYYFILDMVTYSVQIHHEINILEIVVAGGLLKTFQI